MKPFGEDLRRRVLELPEDVPSAEVAERFSVSESFVRKLRQRVRDGGSMAPLPYPGRERLIRDSDEQALAALNPIDAHRLVGERQALGERLAAADAVVVDMEYGREYACRRIG